MEGHDEVLPDDMAIKTSLLCAVCSAFFKPLYVLDESVLAGRSLCIMVSCCPVRDRQKCFSLRILAFSLKVHWKV